MQYQQAQRSMNPVITAGEDVRANFLIRVYQHLTLAVGAFILIEYVLFATGLAETFYNFVFGSGQLAWLAIMGGFVVVNMIGSQAAHRIGNPGVQYAALFAMAAAQAAIFAPVLYRTFTPSAGGSGDVITAALITLLGFAGLSLVAFTTRKELSFLRPILMWGGFVAVGLIVLSAIGIFQLGVLFSVAMVALSGASILYQTQKIVREYPEWAYVGAAVSLFGSLMMMFWYILQIISRD